MPYRAPRPRIVLGALCDASALPAIADVVGPSGVDGSALEADDETMTGLDVPMRPGDAFWVTSPGGDLFRVDVGVTEVTVKLDALAGTPRAAFDYAASILGRLCELSGASAALAPFEVESSLEVDGVWIRTRGLERFGQPELEVYGIAQDRRASAEDALRTVADHLAGGGTIEPGRRLGFGRSTLIAREGERNRAAWGDTVVLELVDVDVTGHSRESGRGLGRR